MMYPSLGNGDEGDVEDGYEGDAKHVRKRERPKAPSQSTRKDRDKDREGERDMQRAGERPKPQIPIKNGEGDGECIIDDEEDIEEEDVEKVIERLYNEHKAVQEQHNRLSAMRSAGLNRPTTPRGNDSSVRYYLE